MSRPALGVLSVLPALVALALSAFEDALVRAAEVGAAPSLVVAGGVVLCMVGGLVAVFAFMAQAVGMPGRGGVWKLAWVVALGTAGVLAAPAFWTLHVWRSPRPPRPRATRAVLQKYPVGRDAPP